MSNKTMPMCTRCMAQLYRRNNRIFGGTALAVGSHDCEAAERLVASAATGAQMFASPKLAVHARFIAPYITEMAWITLLQQWTTTHDLEHRVVPLGNVGSFVISNRVGEDIDMNSVLALISEQLSARGDGPAPERLASVWQSGKCRMVKTTMETTMKASMQAAAGVGSS